MVRSFVWAGDEEVVYVGEAEGQATEDDIYESLGGLGRVPQTERHPEILKQTEGGDDCSLRYVIRMHRNLVKSFDEVYAGKDGGASKL